MSQQQPNNEPTTAQHYNKKEKEKENNINTIVDLDKSKRLDVLEVFNFYVMKFQSPQTKLSNTRKSKIRQRLNDAGKEMLLKAIDNTSRSPHHRGDNDRGWKANIDFIIRSYEQVERLSELDVEAVSTSKQERPNLEEVRSLL